MNRHVETLKKMLAELPFYQHEETALCAAIDAIERFEEMRAIANRNAASALIAASEAGFTLIGSGSPASDGHSDPTRRSESA